MTTPAKNIMKLDNFCIPLFKIELEQSFEQREQDILNRIKTVYGRDLKREIPDTEAKEIANNLLAFGKVIYGVE